MVRQSRFASARMLVFSILVLLTIKMALAENAGSQESVAGQKSAAKLHDGPAWLDLASGKIDNHDGPSKPSGSIILGEVKSGQFAPSHSVLWFGKPTTEQPKESILGWIELKSGKLHPAYSAVAPEKPFLWGWLREKGEGAFVVQAEELKKWEAGQER